MSRFAPFLGQIAGRSNSIECSYIEYNLSPLERRNNCITNAQSPQIPLFDGLYAFESTR